MIVIVGFSTAKKFKLFSYLIRLYQGTKYSHCYLRFYDKDSGKTLIAEAGHGEVHLITHDNWRKTNKTIDEENFNMTQGAFDDMRDYILDNLQVKYSTFQNVGIVLYDLFGVKLFMNGVKGFNCSELVQRALPNLLVPIDGKPIDYIKPSGIHKIIFGKK